KLEYVGVFVNTARDQIIDLVRDLKLSAVQLHGSEDAQYIEALTTELAQSDFGFCQVWQASPVVQSVPLLNQNVSHHVLDGQSPGSGKAFDWQVLALSEQSLSKSFLAGGLNNDNIGQAIEQLTHVDLFGLDLNSGVEDSPGIKSSEKLAQVFSQIRNY
ncbi:MAG: bifunctional indole-3-glycerol phosphate synthase/phosphoribosylanthranilate isomerase, partial [Colwellia sp.]